MAIKKETERNCPKEFEKEGAEKLVLYKCNRLARLASLVKFLIPSVAEDIEETAEINNFAHV